MNINRYESALEAILFAAGESVTRSKLAYCLQLDEKDIKSIMLGLIDKYDGENRGIKIIQLNDAYQMCTNEEFFDFVGRLVKVPEKKQLSPALLETLAIIAYKQPVTKAMIEDIRGVDASHAVNKLMELKLISEAGRLDAPGKPILFSTSEDFLKYFGLKSLSELPSLPEVSEGDLEGFADKLF